MARVISEFLDEKLVRYTEFVFGDAGNAENYPGIMFDQITKNGVWKSVFVCPWGITKYTTQSALAIALPTSVVVDRMSDQ